VWLGQVETFDASLGNDTAAVGLFGVRVSRRALGGLEGQRLAAMTKLSRSPLERFGCRPVAAVFIVEALCGTGGSAQAGKGMLGCSVPRYLRSKASLGQVAGSESNFPVAARKKLRHYWVRTLGIYLPTYLVLR